jgi:hypothetical protein
MKELSADYLVIGSGAMGMAFTDVILHESDATVVIVDKHHQPGGHWNDAYPFVRLHQPSAFYGVNSQPLGHDRIDSTGWNKGLYELATNSEVCAYFDQVMQQQFLPSGRVVYLPMSKCTDAGQVRSLVGGEGYQITASKTVDARYMHVTVPSIRTPEYEVAPAAQCVPVNQLARQTGLFDRFTIVGAGKTGMDACLFLLKNGVDPSAITWIMPRDSWLLDRANIQPGRLFAQSIGAGFARQAEAIAGSRSIEDLFNRIEACGQLLRLDPQVQPTMYRCATVTSAELEQLRRIPDIVRQGRVLRIGEDTLVLEGGEQQIRPRTLHVDCSADGLERRPATPVFTDNRLTLQSVRTCQQVFSAAFIGHIETRADLTIDARNEMCTPVPHPDSDLDFIRASLAANYNAARWAQDPELTQWLLGARLDGFTSSTDESNSIDPASRDKLAQAMHASVTKLEEYVAQIG